MMQLTKKLFNTPHQRSYIAIISIAIYLAGFGFPFDYDYALFILSVTSAVLSLRSSNRKHGAAFIIIAIFVFFLILATLYSIDTARSISFVLTIFPGILIYYLISDCVSFKHIEYLYMIFSALSALLAFWLLWIYFASPITSGPADWIKEASLTFLQVPNDIVLLTIFSPPLLFFYFQKTSVYKKLLMLLVFMVISATIVIYQSRLSLLTLAAYIIAFQFYNNQQTTHSKKILSCLFFFIFFLIVDACSGFFFLKKLTSNINWTTRIPLWLAAWFMFCESPFLGNGPGSFLLRYQSLIERHKLDKMFPFDPRPIPWAHNLYLEGLAEYGVFGFAALFTLHLQNFYTLAKLNSHEKHEHRRFIIYIAFSMWLMFFAAAFVELTFWKQWVSVTFFSLTGLINIFYIEMKQGTENDRL